MASFYIDSGYYNIAGVASFFGIPRGKGFCRNMNNHAEDIDLRLVGFCKDIIKNRLREEIDAVIKDKSTDKYALEEIKEYLDRFNNSDDDVPPEIVILSLAVSYAMGW